MSEGDGKRDSRGPRDTDISNVDPDHPYALTSPARPLFEGDSLDFHAPPLKLPGEFQNAPPSSSPPSEENAHDAWTVDRVGRGGRVSSVPPAPRTANVSYDDFADETTDVVALIDRTMPSNPEHDLTGEMVERFALGDFTGSLRIAELLLGQDITAEAAREYAELCREKLLQLYSSRLGGKDRVPTAQPLDNEKRWISFDRRAAGLYHAVDGVSSCALIVAESSLTELEAWQALVQLYEAGAIEFQD